MTTYTHSINPRQIAMTALEWLGYLIGGAMITAFFWIFLVFVLTLDVA